MSNESEWPKMPLMGHDNNLCHTWHHAINDHSRKPGEWEEMRFMYTAKNAAEEVPRLALLFERERTGKLTKVLRRCSHSKPEPVEDNHLFCCLGVKCNECPHLAALSASAEMTDEQKDWAKAWTCATHVISKGGDIAGEGFILTVDDRMYWDGVYSLLAQSDPEAGE